MAIDESTTIILTPKVKRTKNIIDLGDNANIEE